MTLKIYGVGRSRASRNIWLANELGIAFEHVPVIQAYRLPDPDAADAPFHTASPAFRAVNPNGLIPTMDDAGLILNESLAINLYLAKKHGGPLAPANVAEDGQMTMWALWAVTEVEPHSINVLYNLIGKPEAERDAKVAAAAIAALQRPFDVLEAHLAASGGHVVGSRFTVADINTAEIFRYAQAAPELFASRPHVKRWIEACQARPAYQAMMAVRNAEPA
ncbi:MAG: glutathione S-transferase family protein [Beijerinckiaceae bacterium]